MDVGKLCSREIQLAQPTESAQAAAERMQAKNCGTVLVLDPERRPIGIVTDRDLVLRVMARGHDPRRILVNDVMTAHPRTLDEDTAPDEAVAVMRALGVRRMPVVDADGRVVGMLSVDDLLKALVQELGNLSGVLGLSKPGSGLPAQVFAAGRGRPSRASSGLERASSDPEC
jgi:CBS domain-containing protein